MTLLRFILRSLVHYAGEHAGTLIGAAIGSAVLVGALVVGDSMRASLRRLTELRLGKVDLVLRTGDRLFRAGIFGGPGTQTLIVRPGPAMQARTLEFAPVLHVPAVISREDGTARANHVNLLCVDERFWRFAPSSNAAPLSMGDGVFLNTALARKLGAKVGDQVVIRATKPLALSPDAPLAPEERTTVGRRLRVRGFIGDEAFGRFGLVSQQGQPLNAFVQLAAWSAWLEAPNLANILLLREAGTVPASPVYTMTSTGMVRVLPQPVTEVARLALAQRWTLEDLQIQTIISDSYVELRSPRVFLEPAIVRAFYDQQGGGALAPNHTTPVGQPTTAGVLTYFVNEIRRGDQSTPYSMVTAANKPIVPEDLKDDEIIISDWLAADIAAKPGDNITLKYYVMGRLRNLEEQSANFRVRAVLPLSNPVFDRNLMPDFPGIARAENCRDWDTGLPIQMNRIRPKDEQYWRDYRGTPKAFITLAAGQRIWSNRYGNLTAIRYYHNQRSQGRLSTTNEPASTPGVSSALLMNVTGLVKQNVAPEELGLRFEPVRAESISASAPTQDFGQLFLGFSIFIIAAALILMSLLLQFGLERRAAETGTLLAVGFRPGQVRRIMIGETGLIALAGAAIGLVAGPFYAHAMLTGLTTVWQDAVGGTAIVYHAETRTMLFGAACAMVVCWGTFWLALRRHTRQPVHVLMSRGPELEWSEETVSTTRNRRRLLMITGTVCVLCAIATSIVSLAWPDMAQAGLFFSGGALALAGFMAIFAAALSQSDQSQQENRLSLWILGYRNLARKRRRSMAVIGMLACGCFIVASIGVFRLEAVPEANKRASGTGGFALIGESTHPILHDLDTERGREVYGLDSRALAGVSVVPFRVRDGDEASCLNLARPTQPRLLGVVPELLDKRQAFAFAKVARGLPRERPWTLLDRNVAGIAKDEVPAIGDLASITWALGKKVGDTIDYTDEQGRTFKLRLVAAVANSILQGTLIVSEDEFLRLFPNTAGYRFFLIDAPAQRQTEVAAELARKLEEAGLELTSTAERLAAFNAVQNTYLGTFQALGGLGIVLGSVGLGIVVLRNVFERRAELGLLMAVGWRKSVLYRILMGEHVALLIAGLCAGVFAAALAVVPAAYARHSHIPTGTLVLVLLAVALNGLLWTCAATALSLRQNLREALRNE
ncbi:MAG: ABC transporter permease [Verrucomicrobia bacterium]|nr:ABC transporter permease [Verrucomicrobiota bacterium]